MSRRPARSLALESLEDRLTLTAPSSLNPLETLVTDKGGPVLGAIYTQYTNYYQEGSPGQFLTAFSNKVEMSGATVEVDVVFGAGSFSSNVADMKAIGMAINSEVSNSGLVVGYVPLAQLPAIAMDPNMTSLAPVMKPSTSPVLPPGGAVHAAATVTPADATLAAKGGQTLDSLYQQFVAYEAAGGTGTFTPTGASSIVMAGNAVGVQMTTSAANLNAMIAQMDELGMLVTASTTVGQVGVIDGYLDIASLPAAASNAGLIGMSPIYKQVAF